MRSNTETGSGNGHAAAARARRDAVVADATSRGLPVEIQTRHGRVRVTRVEGREDSAGTWVELWVTTDGDPHYRIFNPPTLVRQGDRLVSDPLGAVAEAVAMNGGAMRTGRSKRRGVAR